MAKTARCNDPEVEAMVAAGTESLEWLREEFSGIDLADKRLDRRLIKIPGARLRCFVRAADQIITLLSFGASARKTQPRARSVTHSLINFSYTRAHETCGIDRC